MSKKIKLIWDFHGQDGKGTADHHVIHLNQFMQKEALDFLDIGVNSEDEFHTMAFMTINESDVIKVRDALKPHRAFVVE